MADLMQQAREAARRARLVHDERQQEVVSIPVQDWATIVTALRAAPEGGVPERTMMALATGWRRHAASGGSGRAVLIQCAESLETAVIAARQQGVEDA